MGSRGISNDGADELGRPTDFPAHEVSHTSVPFINPDTYGGTHAPTGKPRRSNGLATLGIIAAVSVISGSIGGILGYTAAGESGGNSDGVPIAASGVTVPAENTVDRSEAARGTKSVNTIERVAADTQPSVAHITVANSDSGAAGGSGTGFFISENGLMLTNNHVVVTSDGEEGKTIRVQTPDGETYPAEVVGRSPSYDIAVLRVKGIQSKALPLGDSDTVEVGEAVIAVGSPLGLQGTVTSGIISALDRPVIAGDTGEASYILAIQTDAAINPGNSGGPLVNMAGEVIGINSAIATFGGESGQMGSIGLGFAVPITLVKRISDEIIETGSATTPVIGVEVDLSYTGPGARIDVVRPDGTAAAAGLKSGDIITMVEDVNISDAGAFIVNIRALTPGDTVELTVNRGGETLILPVRLASQS